jgi:hypothetical protein
MNLFNPTSMATTFIEELYSSDGGPVARSRRDGRLVSVRLNQLNQYVISKRKETADALSNLRSIVQTQLLKAVRLLEVQQSESNEALMRWILQLCEEYVLLLSTVESLSDENFIEHKLLDVTSKLEHLGVSYLRCMMISGSKRLKRAFAASSDPIVRCRLRRNRIKILKNARKMLQLEMGRKRSN